MLTVPYSVLRNGIYLIKLGGVDYCKHRGMYTGGGVQIRLSFFLSIVRHASTQRRTPAPTDI